MIGAAKEKKTATTEETIQLVTFHVGPEEYGLDINALTEVVRPLKVTTLPGMPQFIEGVINLRGLIIPIVDMRKRFCLRELRDDPKKTRMIITRGAGHGPAGKTGELLGLVVDSVSEVLHVPLRSIDRAPEAATGQTADYIAGLGKVGGRLIIILDRARLLSRQERVALAEAGNVQ